MQIYADADLPSVMNYHPHQTIDQSYVFDKCPTFSIHCEQNQTSFWMKIGTQLCTYVCFSSQTQVKIRRKCSGAATETDIIIRAESRKSLNLLQVCQFFSFPVPLEIVG